MGEDDRGSVCVTGGSGFAGSWLVMRLLQRGYSVRVTLCQADKGKDISYLANLPGAFERLRFYDADLNQPESFDSPIKGCVGVFHVAHPVYFDESESVEVRTERAVRGTLGILEACVKTKTVKRFVHTSSSYAVMFNREVGVMDETNWTDVDYVRATNTAGASYILSKVATERAVLDFAGKHGIDVVYLAASMITGPFICRVLPTSVSTSLALIYGSEDKYTYLMKAPMVHVDDVASAYIFLYEHPEARGRYVCSAAEVTIDEISEYLSAKYPEYQMPPP
ncbi:(3R)-2'-hydroxyisoflavanone reductase, partial [Sarracenia purpurea var. burkii]